MLDGSTLVTNAAGERLKATMFPDQFARTSGGWLGSLDELAEKIGSTVGASKDQLPFIKGALFNGTPNAATGSACLRYDEGVVGLTGWEADIDNAQGVAQSEAARLLLNAGVACLLYATSSSTPEKPRYRVVGAISRSVRGTPQELRALRTTWLGRVNGVLGGIVARESFVLSQSYYFGRLDGSPALQIDVVPGHAVDLLPGLDSNAIVPPGAADHYSDDGSFDWDTPLKETFRPLADDTVYGKLNTKDGDDRSAKCYGLIRQCRDRGYTPEQVFDLFGRFAHAPAAEHYNNHPAGFEAQLRADIRRAFLKPSPTKAERTGAEIFSAGIHPDTATRPGLREVKLAGDYLVNAVDAAEAALIEQGVGLFQRGDFIVRPGAARIRVRDGADVDGERLYEVRPAELREHLTQCAEFVRWDERAKSWKPTNCPEDIARTYCERRGRWALRRLTGIITAPTLRDDGSVLDQPGYDDATGLLYTPEPGTTWPAIPERASRADALAALAMLKELIATFPFDTPADRSVGLSGILTACVRRTLPSAPMHAYSAPRRGTGKGKLVDIATAIATGREAAAVVQGRTEEETEKRLGALLLSGDPAILIDNATLPIEGDFLCSMLTREYVQPRILGQSKAPRLPANVALFATGNNLVFNGDMTRRVLLCTIDAQVEFPERREFAVDPVQEAKRNRPRYLGAALTTLRAFVVAGRPRQSSPLGSFEQWSGLVRDALLWLGEADPCDTQGAIEEVNPEREQLAAVLHCWASVVGSQSVSVKRAIELATEHNGQGEPLRADGAKLIDALQTVAPAHDRLGSQGINARALGHYLRRNAKAVVCRLRLVRGNLRDGEITWRVETLSRQGVAP